MTGFAMKRFTGAKKPITLEFIKGTLLVIADQMVGTIADVIQENVELEGCGKLWKWFSLQHYYTQRSKNSGFVSPTYEVKVGHISCGL